MRLAAAQLDGGGCQFAIGARGRHEFAAARKKFRRAPFGCIGMGNVGCDDAAIRRAQGCQRQGIGRCAVEDKENSGIRVKQGADGIFSQPSPWIVTISWGRACGRGSNNGVKRLRADAGIIVTGELLGGSLRHGRHSCAGGACDTELHGGSLCSGLHGAGGGVNPAWAREALLSGQISAKGTAPCRHPWRSARSGF
ncbi:hypothetical protein ATPR_2469 [Acetobacter tropicalis NBRC 101654]|uniref:Uncharacterized protein n=1 Tax=Acetobacter tropicalis NBRC 101654 TaxID=749388 RepID=F7VGH0_9PROT|nr:hypothetical protein ATPR_2469 [Acetobacter tropicalis NBRC 101654]